MQRLLGLAFLLLCAVESCACLRVAAFNIQVFGQSKFANEEVVATLSQIVQRYDIVLIQEIRDSSETIIFSFLETVNRNRGDSERYDVEVSVRLGRTSSKEQYAFMFRTDVVEVVESLQYVDRDDSFEREPFCVLVRHKERSRVVPDFFLVGVHIRPDDAFAEINSLVAVYEEASAFFGSDNGIILGDFNADCRYISMSQFNTLALVVDERFTWLLDITDTTTGNSTCAYDRIVSAGGITDHMVPDSAGVFRFDQEYSLTQTQALAVSDHYPVEVEFQGAGSVLKQSVLLWAVTAATLLLLVQ